MQWVVGRSSQRHDRIQQTLQEQYTSKCATTTFVQRDTWWRKLRVLFDEPRRFPETPGGCLDDSRLTNDGCNQETTLEVFNYMATDAYPLLVLDIAGGNADHGVIDGKFKELFIHDVQELRHVQGFDKLLNTPLACPTNVAKARLLNAEVKAFLFALMGLVC